MADLGTLGPTPPRRADGPLLLADIGGYTAFLRAVATAHESDAFANGAIPDAYAMMSSLLDGIVGRLVPPFTLSKLEGDAVFAYATDGSTVPRGRRSAVLHPGLLRRVPRRASMRPTTSGRAPAMRACGSTRSS